MQRARRRGIFEGLPRVLYRRTGARYVDACAAGIVFNSVVVALFGLATLALYVDLEGDELGLFLAASAAAYVIEGVVAASYARRAARPVRTWLERGTGDEAAWSAAAGLPTALLRRPLIFVAGGLGVGASAAVLAALLDRPGEEALVALPAMLLFYVSSVILRHLSLELSVRPVLEALGERPEGATPPGGPRVSLHRRLFLAVPMVTWGAAMVVAGLLTDDTRDLDTFGQAGVVAFLVTAAVSTWLSFVLADALTGPIIDLRDATRRVGAGDLELRVPVVSTDETGELAESFNAMVAGLGEREQLREAFGTFVDPALTERVLAEGTDLRGEEVELSVLFLDVREFTGYAERAAPHDVVAVLNELYEAVVPVIAAHGGHANKFIGDGLLAVFGAPERHADHADRAVAAALEIPPLVRERLGGRLRVGIGVNSGRVVAGTIGGGGRRDFTVIGDAVNTASRVEAATRLTGDDVLITEHTLRALSATAARFEERPTAPLRGKSATVRLYAPRS